MDQLNTQPNQNNPQNKPIDHESFSLPMKSPKNSGGKTWLVIVGIVLLVALFFAGGMYIRAKFFKQEAAPVAQVPAGFVFPTSSPPSAQADSLDSIENDLNSIDLKNFEAQINSDLDNINKAL